VRKKMIIKNFGFYQNSKDSSCKKKRKEISIKNMSEIKGEAGTPHSH